MRVYDYLPLEGEYRKEVDLAYGGICDQERIRRYVDWAEVVVWLGAIVGVEAYAFNLRMAIVINRHTVA